MEGHKEVLGLWTSANEGAKFWLSVLNELKTRGVEEVFLACVDGLKGFPQAIEAAYPQTTVQLCIVHNAPTGTWAAPCRLVVPDPTVRRHRP